MAAEYLGGKSVGSAIPIAATATATAAASIGVPLAELNAKLAGATQASLAIAVTPPNIAAAAAASATFAAALTSPTVGVSASVGLLLIAELTAQIALLEAQLSAVVELQTMLGTAGIHMYLCEGEIGQFGTDLQTQLSGGMPGGSGPTQEGVAFVLLAGSPVSIQALRTVFGQ